MSWHCAADLAAAAGATQVAPSPSRSMMISLRFPRGRRAISGAAGRDRRAAMTEGWTQWEGRSVNGIYPLRRFLNSSDHSAVFLTESTTEGFLNAALKLVPASPELIAV